jgi:predicted nucleic acid-binding protein
MSKAKVFLNIENVFDKTWHLGLRYKFSVILMKVIISSFLRENSESWSMMKCLRQGIYKQGRHQVPSCPPHCTVYTYINHTPQTSRVYLGLFVDKACINATARKEVYVLRKLHRGLSAIETWCVRWNIKIN